MNRLLLFLLASLAACSGCSKSTIGTFDSRTGATRIETGKSEWDMFTHSTNWNLEKELRGEEPAAGCKTWEEYWAWRIESTRKYAKDAQRRIAYIKQRRIQLNLPLFEGSIHWL